MCRNFWFPYNNFSLYVGISDCRRSLIFLYVCIPDCFKTLLLLYVGISDSRRTLSLLYIGIPDCRTTFILLYRYIPNCRTMPFCFFKYSWLPKNTYFTFLGILDCRTTNLVWWQEMISNQHAHCTSAVCGNQTLIIKDCLKEFPNGGTATYKGI